MIALRYFMTLNNGFMKNIDNVLVVNSTYSLLVYIILFPNKINNTILIHSDSIPSIISNKFPNAIFVPRGNSIVSKLFNYLKFKFSLLTNLKLRFIIKNKKNLNFYGHDHLFFSSPFLNDFTLVEDGTANYIQTNKKWYIKAILSKKIFGESISVKKIYLSNMAPIPLSIKHKVEIFNIEYSWKSLNTAEKKKINSIFNYLDIRLEFDVILITQPLSEDSIITEKEKINLYKDIIENYKSKKILIRAHPRERTNYKNIFPNCIISSEVYPLELIYLNTPSSTLAITLFSSGIYIFKNSHKIIFGTCSNKSLEKIFGVIKKTEIL